MLLKQFEVNSNFQALCFLHSEVASLEVFQVKRSLWMEDAVFRNCSSPQAVAAILTTSKVVVTGGRIVGRRAKHGESAREVQKLCWERIQRLSSCCPADVIL